MAQAMPAIGQDALNKYNYQVWLDRKPFQAVREAFGLLAETVSKPT